MSKMLSFTLFFQWNFYLNFKTTVFHVVSAFSLRRWMSLSLRLANVCKLKQWHGVQSKSRSFQWFCKKYGSVAARSHGLKFSGLVTLTKRSHSCHPQKPTQLFSKVTFATSLTAFQNSFLPSLTGEALG